MDLKTTDEIRTLDEAEITEKCREIALFMGNAAEAMVKAGERVVELIRGGLRHEDIAARTGLDICMIDGLAKVGWGQMDYRLLTKNSLPAKKLKRLPGPLQSRIIDHGIELALDGGDVLVVQYESLSKEQQEQVFEEDGKGLRSLAKQRAWLEAEKLKQATAKAGDESNDPIYLPKYKISRGNLVWLDGKGPAVLTPTMIADMMRAVARH